MKFKPAGDRILIKQAESIETTKGGIVLPDSAKEKPQEGTIIAIGEGKKNKEGKAIAVSFKVNDKVLYGKYSGTEIKLDGEDYVIIREDDILGTIA